MKTTFKIFLKPLIVVNSHATMMYVWTIIALKFYHGVKNIIHFIYNTIKMECSNDFNSSITIIKPVTTKLLKIVLRRYGKLCSPSLCFLIQATAQIMSKFFFTETFASANM
ncbi:hypothetical protein MXB_2439 [Myxobolus squamalis]|nr:hypothetical protein MXB_2439 [Myxobolus squamalis]